MCMRNRRLASRCIYWQCMLHQSSDLDVSRLKLLEKSDDSLNVTITCGLVDDDLALTLACRSAPITL